MSSIDVLVASPNDSFWKWVGDYLKGYVPYNLQRATSIDSLMEPLTETFNPQLAIVEAVDSTIKTSEWVQAAKMTYPAVPLVVIYSEKCPVETAPIFKNGAQYLLHNPYDLEFLSDILLMLSPVDFTDQVPLSALMRTDLHEFEPNTKIDFDIYTYLHANHKALHLRRKDSIFDGALLDKIHAKAFQLYVKKTDAAKFFVYASRVIEARTGKKGQCQTERVHKAKANIQKFMTKILDQNEQDFAQGKEIFETVQQITQDLHVKNLNPDEIWVRTLEIIGKDKTFYNSAINVACYAAMFSQVLGLKEYLDHSGNKYKAEQIQESLAIAGLFHNVGLSKLDFSKPEELKRLAITSVNLAKRKKVPLDSVSTLAIDQSNEREDGSGPKALKGEKISPFGKILAIAIQFNELTTPDESGQSYSLVKAWETLKNDSNALKGAKNPLDLNMLSQLDRFYRDGLSRHQALLNPTDLRAIA